MIVVDDKALPCPFCGKTDAGVVEGDTFRWLAVQCAYCAARGPDVRVQTAGDGDPAEWKVEGDRKAIAEWNARHWPEPEQEGSASNNSNWLHVYQQNYPHDDVVIEGTKDALIALRNTLLEAICGEISKEEFYCSDGEGYGVSVRVVDSVDRLRRLPYEGCWND